MGKCPLSFCNVARCELFVPGGTHFSTILLLYVHRFQQPCDLNHWKQIITTVSDRELSSLTWLDVPCVLWWMSVSQAYCHGISWDGFWCVDTSTNNEFSLCNTWVEMCYSYTLGRLLLAETSVHPPPHLWARIVAVSFCLNSRRGECGHWWRNARCKRTGCEKLSYIRLFGLTNNERGLSDSIRFDLCYSMCHDGRTLKVSRVSFAAVFERYGRRIIISCSSTMSIVDTIRMGWNVLLLELSEC